MPAVDSEEDDLPLTVFQVLEEEFVAIHGPLPAAYPNWDITAEQIRDATRIVRVLSAPSATSNETDPVSIFLRHLVTLAETRSKAWRGLLSVEQLPVALNMLLGEPELYCQLTERGLPLREETREIVRVHFSGGRMKLCATDLRRFNRLLLEDVFPDNLTRINDFRMAAIAAKRHETASTALCLSGGGIRSGTFSLGVLQGMAKRGLLGRFHYLSTVSGGGYIGSWLTAWAHRHTKRLDGVVEDLKKRADSKLDPEPEPLRHLREYSNFVAPRFSLVSADLWSFVAIYLRNLLINWSALIPLLLGVLLIPRILVALLLVPVSVSVHWLVPYVLLGVGFILSVVAVLYVTINRPSRADLLPPESWLRGIRGQGSFLRYSLLPTVLAGLCLSIFWAWYGPKVASCFSSPRLLMVIAGLGIGIYVTSMILASLLLRHAPSVADGSAAIFTGAGGGVITWLLVSTVFAQPIPMLPAGSLMAAWYACLALPAYLLVFFGAATIFVAATSKRRALNWNSQWFAIEDEDREWIGRHGGWLLIVALGWAAGSGLVIFGPFLLLAGPKLLASAGGVSGVLSILGGKSALTPATDKSKAPGWKMVLLENALSLLAMIFLAVIVAALSLLSSWGIQAVWKPLKETGEFATLYFSPAQLLTLLAVVAGGAGLLASWVVNLNKFSLHAAYRGRIIRAFLGASRPPLERDPNPFTGFDPQDNIQMHELRPGLLREASFKPGGLVRLAVRLRDSQRTASTDGPSHELSKELSGVTKTMLARLRDSNPLSQSLKRNLLEDLNGLLDGDPGLVGLRAFANATSSAATRKIVGCALGLDLNTLPLAATNDDLSRKLPPQGRINTLLVLNRSMLDSVYSAELEPIQGPPPPYRLLHVVGAALNLVGGKRLAWQQRRAESLTISPLHCGSLYRGYRRSRRYGGPDGISLGTAITISGAAVSSNMGYHSSSAAVAFVLTLFNARLGWWLGNPGVAGSDRSGMTPYTLPPYRRAFPRMSLAPLVMEAFGLTDDTSRYVLLSDGGHFDNLGLYEMVLRRCRLILVVDGSQDENASFDDLGAAVRKIRIDLGIDITFEEPMAIYKKGHIDTDKEKNHYCAVATIHYPDGDGSHRGFLVYIKPAILGEEPRDILQYAAANPAFPHQTTVDQFFDESQFESYRKLGEHIVQSLCGDATSTDQNLSDFITSVYSNHLKRKPRRDVQHLVRDL